MNTTPATGLKKLIIGKNNLKEMAGKQPQALKKDLDN